MAAPRKIRFEIALVAALLVFVAGLCLLPITESDLFFRLKVGQEILARHALLGRNTFSFTAPDYPDLDLAWAFEVAAALVYELAGFPGVVVAKTAVVAGTFAGAFFVCRRRGAGSVAAVVALAAAAWVMRERFVERPHIASFAGEIVVLAAVTALPRGWSRRRVAAFVAAMIAWANFHAGSFAGAFMLGLAGVGFVAADRRAARRAFALAAAAAAAAFATPAGAGIVRYLWLHVTLPRIHTVDEFRAATWRSDAAFFVWAAVAAAIVAASAALRRRGDARGDAGGEPQGLPALAELLPALGMAIVGALAVRFAADAALVLAVVVAPRLSRMARALPAPIAASRVTAAVVACALVAGAVAPRIADARARRRPIDLRVDWSIVPRDAITFVNANGLRERMYNDFEIGSYLAFEGYPRYRVFVDPRLPAYPESLHRLLGSFDLSRAAWSAAMDAYGVQSALLGYAGVNRRVAWWDPERWALVYRAGDARVFVRRTERWRDLIARLEVPATFSFTVEEGAVTLPLEARPAASPVAECEWQHRLGDLAFDLDRSAPAPAYAHYERALAQPGCLAPRDEAGLMSWLGALEIADHRFDSAVQRFDRALALVPDDVQTLANRGVANERLGRRAAAAEDWDRVAALAAGTPLGGAARAEAQRLNRP